MNYFKLSTIAVACWSTFSYAAIYQIERVDQASLGFAEASAISSDGSQVGYQAFQGPVGIPYGDELPYMIDFENYINSQEDLYFYCVNYLGYNTCDTWANERWSGINVNGEVCTNQDSPDQCLGGLRKEIDAWSSGFQSNSLAFVNGTATNPFASGIAPNTVPPGALVADSTNVTISGFSSTGAAIGFSSSPYYQNNGIFARGFGNRGFVGTQQLLPPANSDGLVTALGETRAHGAVTAGGREFVFGSAAIALMSDPGNINKVPEGSGLASLAGCTSADYTNRACQYIKFANQATVWLDGDPTKAQVVADFPNGTAFDDDTAQASVEGAAVVAGINATAPLMVGFSSYPDNEFFARAVVFQPVADFSTCLTSAGQRCWQQVLIPGLDIRQNGDIVYSYTKATDVNSNGVVVGVVKNARLLNGSYAENVFAYNANNNTTVLLNSGYNPLFFNGYNATANAINDNNELVGKVDVENIRDRARRQRGYIYLHENAPNLAAFNNVRGWLLDDLTNDGNQQGNANKYRIAEALDIADNGDIAASAFYCASGYNTVANNAFCNEKEQLVAVKLTRQAGAIQPRAEQVADVSRSGGAVGGIFVILLSALTWIRRQKVKIKK